MRVLILTQELGLRWRQIHNEMQRYRLCVRSLTAMCDMLQVRALILMRNRGTLSALEVLPTLFRLFRCHDKALRQLLFRHIIAGECVDTTSEETFSLGSADIKAWRCASCCVADEKLANTSGCVSSGADIKSANRKHQDNRLNRGVQAFLYGLLQQDEEATALRALAVLTELHRRNVWRDARTVNVIGEHTECHGQLMLTC